MEASNFFDADGHTHLCSDWQIWTVSGAELVWDAPCLGGVEKIHIHLGDGTFMNSYAGRRDLNYDTAYNLRVRFRDSAGALSAWSERLFKTSPAGPPGQPADVPWTVRQGYRVETVASGLRLPVNIAMVPHPGSQPGDPFMYVTELYGNIKVITRAGTVKNYATGLLNFDPNGGFPGTGEQGLTGILVDPASGDVFADTVYESTVEPRPHFAKVVRFHSNDGGLTAATQTTVLDMNGELVGPSHQVSNLTIGPDGKLYVHNGDGGIPSTALDLNSFRGKVLRMNLDGTVPSDNPFYNASDGVTARDYIFAYGFRNPFGGAWRAADGSHYEVENGPSVDRFAKITSGDNFKWGGSDSDMRNLALYNWDPAHAPVNIAFVQPESTFGSGFPFATMGHAFVTESGPTFATGPQALGKRIVEFAPSANGTFGGSQPDTLAEYTGTGKATALGLAAGPDGLYFTDLYNDLGANPTDPGAHLFRVRYVAGVSSHPRPGESLPGGLGASKRSSALTVRLKLSGPKIQRIGKRNRLVVFAICDRRCAISAFAAVSVRGTSKILRTRSLKARLPAAKRIKLRLKFRKRALRSIRRTLLHRKRLTARVRVAASIPPGKARRASRTVRLRR
jgi:glucose/arabinose dehydrogenase